MFDPIKNPFRRFGTLAFSFIFIACEPVTGVEIGVVSDDAYEEEWNEMESAAPPESEDLEPVSEENPGDKEVPAGEEVDTEEIEDYEEGEDFEEEVEEEEDFEDDFEEEEEEDFEDDFEEEEETPEVEEPVPGSSTENGTPTTIPDAGAYLGTGETCCGEDPHPVHGVEAPDGSFILCGKSGDSGGEVDGFVVKFQAPFPAGSTFIDNPSSPLIAWSHSFGKSGHKDGANHVAVLDEGVFVAGFEESSAGTVHASFKKLDLASGEVVWTALFPSAQANTDSAFESIQRTGNGGVILGGFEGGAQGGVEGFKSYGNPTSGKARMMAFSPEQLASNSAPVEASWSKVYPQAGSMRQVRELPSGGFVFLAASPEEGGTYRVVRTGDSGEVQWETLLDGHGEATDVALLTEQGEVSALAVSGHVNVGKGIDGSITTLSLNGEVLWNQTVGNPVGGEGEFAGLGAGAPALIFDECWGITGDDQGGMVVACGTGIEGCDELGPGSPLLSECKTDPRTKWRGMLIGLDSSGNPNWSRTDSFVFPGENEAAASASEYVIRTQSGGYASIVDQDFGIGLLLINPPE